MSTRPARVIGALAVALPALAAAFVFAFLRTQAGTPAIDISGDCNLLLEGNLIASCELQIEQSGDQLSGTWSCSTFGDGTYTGVLIEDVGETSFELDGQIEGYPFAAEGTVAPDASSATGTWSSDLGFSGTFLAHRKPAATPVGDANCSDEVDSIDAALILQLNAGLLDDLACEGSADVNGDGRVDSIDALLVLQFVAGLLDTLPPASGSPSPIFY